MSRIASCALAGLGMWLVLATAARAQETKLMTDTRTAAPRWARDAYPWRDRIETLEQWQGRSERIRRNLLVAAGLWPEPTRTPLEAVVHGRKACDGYTVEKVGRLTSCPAR